MKQSLGLAIVVLSMTACSGNGSDALSQGLDASAGDAAVRNDASASDSRAADAADTTEDTGAEDMDASPSADASGDGEAALDAELDAGPPFDAGVGCNAPSDTPLSATQAGLPIAGLVVWLRADHGVYKTDAGAVCAWADNSGGGHIFSGDPNARPIWLETGAADLPAIHFLAAQGLSVGDALGIPAQSGRTFVAVQTLTSTTVRFHAIIQGLGGSAGTYLSLDTNTFQTEGSREGVYVTNNSYDSDLATSTATRLHVFAIDNMVVSQPIVPGIAYRVDGANVTLNRRPGGLGDGNFEDFSQANFTTVGAGDSGSDTLLSEVLVYDHALTRSELTALETALMARYGL